MDTKIQFKTVVEISLFTTSKLTLSPTQPLQMGSKDSYHRDKASEVRSCPLSSSTEVKNVCSYTALPHTPACQGIQVAQETTYAFKQLILPVPMHIISTPYLHLRILSVVCFDKLEPSVQHLRSSQQWPCLVVFSAAIPCGLIGVYHFRERYCPHLQPWWWKQLWNANSMLLWNAGIHLKVHTASQCRKTLST